jgi:hypothetical protein
LDNQKRFLEFFSSRRLGFADSGGHSSVFKNLPNHFRQAKSRHFEIQFESGAN